ncbi:hypothetical protein BGZ80_009933 [Entomortierella chlamydospora]|uniref:Cas12f1-like TNB domain-containing protein n=1 Tax=Entomortierella chlamydospora TaxID=101097 RepID=A0A9P6T0D9_9FUNG|nr:hypothetical protein BGZ79_008184 [Entomortierella chlamydospora]KAG0015309.1 hypothetical protein BGZ80_009933 [Entomortierella chlamydospora]
MAVIGIGLGKFSSMSRLSTLHESFLSYFVPLARSLDYIVIGVNEYYSSKKCPVCEEFVAQVAIRRLYCSHCGVYMHRDIMAADNMCRIVQSYLLQQRRPRYLQPVDEKGHYPWEEDCDYVSENSVASTTSPSQETQLAADPALAQ